MTALAQLGPPPGQGPPAFTPKFPPAPSILPTPAPSPAPVPPAPAPIPAPAPQATAPTQPAILQPLPLPIPTPAGMPGWVVPALVVGIGLILGVVALILWRRAHRIEEEEVLRVLDIDPESAGTEHVEFPPIDLHQPIFGEAAWRAIRTHADDATYLHAVEVVRERYGDTGHPMTLANLLRATMAEGRVGFRDAMLRLADLEDEDARERRWSGPVLDETGQPIDPEAEEPEPAEDVVAAPAQDGPRLAPLHGGSGRIFDVEEPVDAADAAEPLDTGDWVVDLTRPIGAAEWVTILIHAEAGGYVEAAQAVQARYRSVIDRMLLPNTLRNLMAREGLDFAAAMARAAALDPMRPRRG